MPDPLVVILANEMDAGGTLNAETRGRLEIGCAEAHRLNAARTLCMGWAYRPDSDLPIAQAMRDHARAHALPMAERLEVDPRSRDTVGDAILSRRRLSPAPGTPVIVATSDYHAARTTMIFARVWGPAHPLRIAAAPTDRPDRTETERPSIDAFLRTFDGIPTGDLDAFLRRLLTAHPFYDGRAFPDRPFDLGLDDPPPGA
jgi:uncharacterized SAM-binding protein YcdF (DUF218 family)